MSDAATIVIIVFLDIAILTVIILLYLENRKLSKVIAKLQRAQEQPVTAVSAEDEEQPLVCPECKDNRDLMLISESQNMWFCDTCKKMIKKV